MAFRTFTFVVRIDEDLDQDHEDFILEEPTALLAKDSIMFWGQEHGISRTALELGADPALWADEEEE